MQGELGRLSHRAHEHKQAEGYSGPTCHLAIGHGSAQAGGHAFEIKGAGGPEQPEDAQQQTKVADAVHYKSFLSGVSGTIAVVPKAHQQVGAHAHQLPEDVNLKQVGAHNQPQH